MNGWNKSDFDFGSMSDEETCDTMRDLYSRTGYVLEPHAAIAYQILKNSLKEGETGIFLGTAHPAKFKEVVDKTLGIDIALPMQAVTLKPDYENLKSYVLEAVKA